MMGGWNRELRATRELAAARSFASVTLHFVRAVRARVRRRLSRSLFKNQRS